MTASSEELQGGGPVPAGRTVLVVGGTGHLGRVVVPELLERGHPVRVLSRGAAAATDLAEAGADLRVGDVRNPDDVRAAMDGVGVCVSAMQGLVGTGGVTPESVDRDGNRNLVDAASAQGAAVVLMSILDAGPGSPMEMARMKAAAEEYLRASGVPFTIVRAGAFAETWGDILRGTRNSSGRLQVFGKGENPVNFVAIADVATAVVRAVTDTALRGKVIEVGGPENLTMNQFAAMVGDSGRPARHVPRPVLRLMGTLARPVKPELARMARASVAMDTADLRFDPATSLHEYPWLTATSIRTGVRQP